MLGSPFGPIVTFGPDSIARSTPVRSGAIYIGELAAIAFIYFWLVKLGLTLASINSSISPVWPATGMALAMLLLRGYPVWPAIFVGAFLANATSAGSLYTSMAIAAGNTLEGVIGAWLINRWSGGVRTFRTPAGIAKVALLSAAATAISPAIGVPSLGLSGYAEGAKLGSLWTTWWLGDLAGAIVVTPVIVLWAAGPPPRVRPGEAIAVFAVAACIGLIAFGPMIEQTGYRDPLGFLAVVPLVWAALRRDPRDTATAALILSAFAIWGTLAGGGPFAWAELNESFLLLLMFMVSAALPSLMLSAMAAQLQDSYATLERKVEERTHQLALANLAKSRFIAVASHDLRQPLHALGLFVAQLRECLDAAERSRLVERIDVAVAAISELFIALLDISKLDAGALTPKISQFPIANLLKTNESMFAETAREKGLSLRIVSSTAWIRSDDMLLERILQNLVSNAARYTTHGGIVVGCRRRGRQLRIEVWDSGPGIPEDQRQNIFGEFYRLAYPERDRQAGLGLGLAIVERLCRLLDHPIELTSTIGKGSRFAVVVPLATALTKSVEAQPSREAKLDPARGKLVVVIDDDPLVLDSMGGLLRSWGCGVVTASSEHSALAVLAEHDRPPDLIIADYRLSDGKSGIEAVARLRTAFNASIPAFLISGDTDPERLREARASGYHLLHKPVRPMALRAMLSQFLAKRDVADAVLERPNFHSL
jgi:signal transduction histidine kinase